MAGIEGLAAKPLLEQLGAVGGDLDLGCVRAQRHGDELARISVVVGDETRVRTIIPT